MTKVKINNCLIITQTIFKLFKSRVSDVTIKQTLFHHKDYPSLSSIIEVLTSFGFSCLAVSIKKEQLKKIPLPAIGHFQKNGQGYFSIFTQVDDNGITILNDSNRTKRISYSDLSRFWKGTALLLELDNEVEESDYKSKHRKEVIIKNLRIGTNLLLCSLLIGFSFIIPTSSVLPYALNLLGLFISGLLISKQLRYDNGIVDKVCHQGQNSDCESVLNSSAAKVFGIFPLSEIVFIYFIAMTSAMLISPTVGSLNGYFLIFSSLACFFTIFTIYYQWRVIRKWCPLCLILSLLLWVQFTVYAVHADYTFSLAGGTLIFGIFVLLTSAWISLRDAIITSIEVPALMRKLNRFRQSAGVFESILSKQPAVRNMKMDGDLVKGSPDSPLSLTLVSHPGCKYCAEAHKKVDELSRKYGDKLRISYRFNVHPNAETPAYQILLKIFKLNLSSNNGKAFSALSDWYKMRGSDIVSWNTKYDLQDNNIDTRAEGLIKEHYEWSNSAGVTHTPTVFFNNRKLPEEFELDDLDYHIGRMRDNQ